MAFLKFVSPGMKSKIFCSFDSDGIDNDGDGSVGDGVGGDGSVDGGVGDDSFSVITLLAKN